MYATAPGIHSQGLVLAGMLAVLVLLQMWQQQCWHWLVPLPLQQLPQLLGADTLQQ